jgi:hypothetical protein
LQFWEGDQLLDLNLTGEKTYAEQYNS